jgi:hypothetical protein
MPGLFAPTLTALALTHALAAPTRAADPFTDAAQAACGPYRAALFRTNSQAQAESEQAVAQVHETLETMRDLLADLRRRNQVIVYSDHMNACPAEMEHVLGEGPKLLAQPQGAMELLARTGALDYLAGRLQSDAPQALRAYREFVQLVAAVRQSAARAALGQVKKP